MLAFIYAVVTWALSFAIKRAIYWCVAVFVLSLVKTLLG